MVYQAVAEYWANSKEPEYSVSVDILLPGRSSPQKYQVNKANHYLTRTTEVKTYSFDQNARPKFYFPHSILFMCLFLSSGEHYKSEYNGDSHRVWRSNSKGKTPMELSPYLEFQLHQSDAIFCACQMVSLYYALPKEKASNCQKFDMSVQLIPGKAALSLFAFLVF